MESRIPFVIDFFPSDGILLYANPSRMIASTMQASPVNNIHGLQRFGDISGNDTQNQSQPHTDRECDGHAGDIDYSNQ